MLRKLFKGGNYSKKYGRFFLFKEKWSTTETKLFGQYFVLCITLQYVTSGWTLLGYLDDLRFSEIGPICWEKVRDRILKLCACPTKCQAATRVITKSFSILGIKEEIFWEWLNQYFSRNRGKKLFSYFFRWDNLILLETLW